jgi:hypothetical protein
MSLPPTADKMLVKIEEVARIEVSSRNLARGKHQQLSLLPTSGGFAHDRGLVGLGLIQEFLEQVDQAPVPGPQKPILSLTHPYLEVRIMLWSGDEVCLKSRSNRSYMLPFFQNGIETYNPRLSRTLAALIPKGFLNRKRLQLKRATI